jgi:nodulation protein E
VTPLRRVVVTGLGAVSALGTGREAHLEGLREGRSGIAPISLIDPERLKIKIAAEAKSFRGADHFDRQQLPLFDRVTEMAVVAAREAAAQSGIAFDEMPEGTPEGTLGARTATVIGTAMGGLHTLDENYRAVYGEMKNRVHPLIIPRLMGNAPVSQISIEFGLTGPAWSVSTACSSSNHAIAQAFQLVRSGAVDAAVTGGTESVLCFGGIKAWEGLRVMSPDGCRPFAKTRNGMVLGEGAAILILEELERARARGAPILGEIAGAGMTADAGDIVAPSLDDARRGRLHQRPRHRDGDERPHRGGGNSRGVRRRGRVGAGLLDQVDARPLHRCRRSVGGGRHPDGNGRGRGAADDQL